MYQIVWKILPTKVIIHTDECTSLEKALSKVSTPSAVGRCPIEIIVQDEVGTIHFNRICG